MTAPTPSTLIDRVDRRDHPVGRVQRSDALQMGANFRTVHVFVFDGAGRLLLQQLAPTRERHPERWGSSVAAYLYAGESYRQGAERRMYDELGLRGHLKSLGKIRMIDQASMKFVALFAIEANRAEIREPEHIAQVRYWPLSQLDRDVESRPERFTPTFLSLYSYFRRRQTPT